MFISAVCPIVSARPVKDHSAKTRNATPNTAEVAMPTLVAAPVNVAGIDDVAEGIIMELVEFMVRFCGIMTVPLLSSRPHMGLGSSWHEGSVHMDWSCGPASLTTVVGAAAVVEERGECHSSSLASSTVTPNEVAARPTC